MREIKFRSWDKLKSEMIYSGIEYELRCLSNPKYDKGHESDTIGFINNNESHFDIEQYTGLKDKNGKEIYEGDILSINGSRVVKIKDNSEIRLYVNSNIKDEFETIKEKSNFICAWNDIFSSFSFTSKTHSISMDIGKRDYEIIGNIHENPELIK